MRHAQTAVVGLIAVVVGYLLGMQISGGPTVPMGELRDENRELQQRTTTLERERDRLEAQLRQAAEADQQTVSSEYGRLMDEGVGHFKAKRYDSSIEDFTRALAIAQGSRGMAYQDNGDWANAIGDYRKVLEWFVLSAAAFRKDNEQAVAAMSEVRKESSHGVAELGMLGLAGCSPGSLLDEPKLGRGRSPLLTFRRPPPAEPGGKVRFFHG